MGENTKIEWATHTFNAWWGCTKVSQGCTHCYAATMDKRTGGDHWGPGKPRKTMSDSYWRQPLKWDSAAKAAGERHRVFCSSMADVFDIEAPAGQRERLWDLIRQTPNLDWLLLTKRPERIAESLPADWGDGYPNVWLGTTVEDQAAADKRVPVLLAVPAVVRFLSCEPLIGPVDLLAWLDPTGACCGSEPEYQCSDCPATASWRYTGPADEHGLNEPTIDWVIVGGESGVGARPMHPAWVKALRDQCTDEGIAFLFKQWGRWQPMPVYNTVTCRLISYSGNVGPTPYPGWGKDAAANGWVVMQPIGKPGSGRDLDGQIWDEFPAVKAQVLA